MEKPTISMLIPDPFRTQLIAAGKRAGEEKLADELAIIGAHINTIRAACAVEFPNLFKESANATA